MRLIQLIKIWLQQLLDLGAGLQTGIDSHKWENKIEILGCLSRGYH